VIVRFHKQATNHPLETSQRAVVFSFYQKTRCQAMERIQSSLPMVPDRPAGRAGARRGWPWEATGEAGRMAEVQAAQAGECGSTAALGQRIGGRPGQTGLVSSLLLVEDDRELSALLDRLLTQEGYVVTVAGDGQRGLHLGLSRSFDLMVVDRGLPAVEGLDLVQRLRARGVLTPVLVLSARGGTQERVDGLDAGAEDYLAKPFEVVELLARLRALGRRHRDSAPVLSLGASRLEVSTRTVTGRAAGDVELSERETALLAVLAGRPRQVFSRRVLLVRVFGDADSDNVVDTYVHYCRRKLGRDCIRTVRGLGYRLGTC